MKAKTILTIFISALKFTVFGQVAQPFDYVPYFSAVIVSNVETSVSWYQSVLGLKINKQRNDPKNSYKVAVLESPVFSLELLELKGSLMPKSILAGKPEGTKIQGHFKIGFKVTNMDACLNSLAKLKIKVDHVWTDAATKKRNFLISDPDGNLIQFFE